MTKIDLVGQRFGQWTVIALGDAIKCICLCDCGSTRAVNIRSLVRGLSKSCGCLRNSENRKKIIGKRFGRLIALSFSHFDKYGASTYVCGCDCGNTKVIARSSLVQGLTKSCGCLPREIRNDLTGRRFGKMTVLQFSHTDKQGRSQYVCQCDCGNTKICAGRHLIDGGIQSCKCILYYDKTVLTGQRFGKLTVIGYSHSSKTWQQYYTCKCDCGKVVIRTKGKLKDTSSCGCDRESKYKVDVGQRFGRLLVVGISASGYRSRYTCQCDCGNTKSCRGHDLIKRMIQSCGCYNREQASITGSTTGINRLRGKGYYFEKDGQVLYMRSVLEVMGAVALTSHSTEWQYEPQTFVLAENVRYRPDFYLPATNEWIETKGIMYLRAEHKIELFRKHHRLSVWFDKDVEASLGIRYHTFAKKLRQMCRADSTVDLAELTGNPALVGCKVRAATSPKP